LGLLVSDAYNCNQTWKFMMIPCQRHLFDIPDDIAYFNCAYMSPLMKKVVAEGHKSVALKGQPWQISPPDFFSTPERARALFAQLINAQADDIAIIPSCSYGTATAANNLPINKGQEILVLQDQFPSHVYPWRELAADKDAEIITIPRGGNDGWTPRILAAITANTAIVALPHCHWTDGSLVDLVAVGRRCREVGAALAIDMTQSIAALPFDVAEIQPDFAVAAGYKWMMGPYSLGFMYVAPQHQDGPLNTTGSPARTARISPVLSITSPSISPARAALTWAKGPISSPCPWLSRRWSNYWNGVSRKSSKAFR
jgi:selenocysteine lyase/cysteine desulfurase